MDELSCQQLVDLVSDYIEGALSAQDRQRFDAHLAECDGCTFYVGQMRRTIAALGTLRIDDVAPEVREELRLAFREWNTASA